MTITSTPFFRVRLFALSAAFLLAASACDGGCGGAKMPDTAAERSEQMAERLPADTQMSFVVSDLERMRTSLKSARDTIGDRLPVADLVEEQARAELGIDLFDEESWKESGIAADGGMVVTTVGEYPVFLTYVDDRQRFEKHLADQLNERFDTEAATKSETVDDTQVKYVGGERESTAAWAQKGELVAVAMPPVEEVAEVNDEQSAADDVKQLVADLMSLETKESLASLDSYGKFTDALADERAMSVFVNNDEVLTDDRVDDLEEESSAAFSSLLDWSLENVRATGLGLEVEDNSLELRGWADLPAEVRERLDEVLGAPTEIDLDGFATEHTMAALRLAVDMPKLWDLYKETASDEELEEFETMFEDAAADTDLDDFEEDVIDRMTGNLGAYVYGVDKEQIGRGGPAMLQSLMLQPMQSVALLVPVQFDDVESREAIVKALEQMNETGADFERETVKGDVHVLKNTSADGSRGQFFYKDDLLVFASGVFADESVYEYIESERDEAGLGEVEDLDLGRELAEGDDYNGLYLNFIRARDHLGDLLADAQPQAMTILDKLEEAALTGDVGKNGAHVDLTLDLAPQEQPDEGE